MFAGHDTTSMTICYILTLLAEHKDIQECVRNEIDAAMQEHEGKITMKLLQQLPYLERCIKEGMRLYPVASSIARTVEEDVKLRTH
ncbi:PREDICTED: cytochrome P450 4C1-like [Wasmannia auropunctata]|uniref:cytochrome P450 4C1-like n=1 Tax=Wasmannia auropunctata TaxID=64793 RepID=UPI0005EDD86D|nr:PREDICTED: cytochrome P450 4C1-like [Wasmannia auropunctata]